MANEIRPNTDSREAFTSQEQEAYEYEPTQEDLDEMCDYFESLDLEDEEDYDEEYDGQPDEYTEWQDFYGGDDWDHGQYDEVY